MMRGRGKALRELSIIRAFDIARIRGDAEAGKPKTLTDYLSELLSDDERRERDEARFFAMLDRSIGSDTLQ